MVQLTSVLLVIGVRDTPKQSIGLSDLQRHISRYCDAFIVDTSRPTVTIELYWTEYDFKDYYGLFIKYIVNINYETL